MGFAHDPRMNLKGINKWQGRYSDNIRVTGSLSTARPQEPTREEPDTRANSTHLYPPEG
jgi:hypothetical protein